MNSSLGWIDFSSIDRNQLYNVLNLLSEPGVVDELGIGSIRDSFSDTLFPGISTIQTRAKYFISIPRIIRDFEKMTDSQRRRVGGLARYLAEQEDECARLFAKSFIGLAEDERKGTGIIGITALKAGVLRKPSEIYWGGLRTFGIISTKLSRAEFCRQLDKSSQTLRLTTSGSEKEAGDDGDAAKTLSSVQTPLYHPDWQESLTIDMTRAEAEFLLHQMNDPLLSGSLIVVLLQDEKLRKRVLEEGIEFNQLPDLLGDAIPARTGAVLQQAVDFWTIMRGAHIRYNCLLQKKFGTPEVLVKFEDEWLAWCREIKRFPWSRWDIQSVWSLAKESGHKIKDFTQRFIEFWCNEVRQGIEREGALDRLDKMISQQEQKNKPRKARLPQTGGSVRVSGWIGISELTYRFPQTCRILTDLQAGLERLESHA